jgi:hypothetical protein
MRSLNLRAARKASPRRARNLTLPLAVCACACAAVLALPASALADSMSLSIAPEPVANLTSEISWAASSEAGTLAVVAVNNPGVPCGADPAADEGQTVTPEHSFEPGSSGAYTGSVNYTPPSAGAYTVCGWLELPAGLIEGDGGPVTAAASLPIQVRAPHMTLALALPRRPAPWRAFTLDLTASTEAEREVIVEGFALTKRGCPVNPAAEQAAAHLIDQDTIGGPWTLAANVAPLRPGSYIFCAWADPPSEELDPQATTKLIVRVPAVRHRRRSRR